MAGTDLRTAAQQALEQPEPAEPVAVANRTPLENSLRRAYYYDEHGKWRGPETDEWDRWHCVAKVALKQTALHCETEQQQLEDAGTFNDGVLEGMLRERVYWLRQQEQDTDCHAQGICQRSGYSIGQPEPEPDRWGAGYEAGYAAGVAEMKPEQAGPVEIKPPNPEGATLCTVRWWAETPAGWVGAWDREALEQFTRPPRREWRGLTKWEIDDGRDQLPTEDLCDWSFRRGIHFAEDKLKEKNHHD
jgi:hypothetical protein